MLYQSAYAFTAYRWNLFLEAACNSSAASLPLRFMLQDLNDKLQMALALATWQSSTKPDSSSFSLKSFLEKSMYVKLDTAVHSSQMTGRDLAESPDILHSKDTQIADVLQPF